jgi:hypothetical protein
MTIWTYCENHFNTPFMVHHGAVRLILSSDILKGVLARNIENLDIKGPKTTRVQSLTKKNSAKTYKITYKNLQKTLQNPTKNPTKKPTKPYKTLQKPTRKNGFGQVPYKTRCGFQGVFVDPSLRATSFSTNKHHR